MKFSLLLRIDPNKQWKVWLCDSNALFYPNLLFLLNSVFWSLFLTLCWSIHLIILIFYYHFIISHRKDLLGSHHPACFLFMLVGEYLEETHPSTERTTTNSCNMQRQVGPRSWTLDLLAVPLFLAVLTKSHREHLCFSEKEFYWRPGNTVYVLLYSCHLATLSSWWSP